MSHNKYGRIPINRRLAKQELLEIQQNQCFYCHGQLELRNRRSRRYATLDHVVPLVYGGDWSFKNLVIACAQCNHDKDCMSAAEFMAQRAIMIK